MYSTQTTNYRADIDGLRAIAILGVVFFHAFPELLPGGFVGVDIFFVISGYLISSLIWRNLAEDDFSFVNFYRNRILRLFPALVLVLFCCIVLGAFFMLANEYKSLGADILAAAGFVSNFKMWHDINYFSSARELNPLSHLWSLGIEEQFYIFWPLLLWSTRDYKKNFLTMVVLIGAISFCLNVATVSPNESQAFYSPFTRIWELTLGAILAHWSTLRISFDNLKSFMGIFLIAFSFWAFDGKMSFPGYAALIPTMGTFLLISSPNSFFNRMILSNQILVWIGLISYPLYLWHQVLFAYAQVLGRLTERNFWFLCSLIAASFILAGLTFYFIEKPFRRNKKVAMPLVILLLGCGASGGLIFNKNGFPARYAVSPNDLNERFFKMFGNNYHNCNNTFGEEVLLCIRSDSNIKPRVAVVGDSHAAHLFNGLHESADPQFKEFVIFAKQNCAPKVFGNQSNECKHMMEKAFQKIENESSADIIILAGFPYVVSGFNDKFRIAATADFVKTFDYLLKMNKKIIFFIDGPEFTFSPETCAQSNLYLRSQLSFIPEVCKGNSTREFIKRPQYDLFVKSLRDQYKNDSRVYFYDAFQYLCPDGCPLFREGKLIYSDTHHFSKYASKWVVQDLIKKYRKK